jgi:Domain of unknown function (DUF4192)
MSRTRQQVLKATALRDVVAAVPFQCGFHPRRSVVVLSLRGPRKRVGQVTRADLPEPDDIDEAAAELAEFVVRDRGSASLVVVYDDEPWDASIPPRLATVTALLEQLDSHAVPAADALYVTRERYWSYLCRDRACCPPEGQRVADAQSSPVAAAYVLAGLAPLPDRESLAARVHPLDPELVAAVAESTWRWLAAFAAELDDAGDPPTSVRGRAKRRESSLRQRVAQALALLDEVLPGYSGSAAPLSVERAGRLIALLQDVGVRDAVIAALCRGSVSSVAPAWVPSRQREPDPVLEDAVERLLVDLCVRVEGPLACGPLTVLAWHSWARGEGALARIAVDRARAEDPTYRLAVLLSSVLDHALAPDWVTDMRQEDEHAG